MHVCTSSNYPIILASSQLTDPNIRQIIDPFLEITNISYSKVQHKISKTVTKAVQSMLSSSGKLQICCWESTQKCHHGNILVVISTAYRSFLKKFKDYLT